MISFAKKKKKSTREITISCICDIIGVSGATIKFDKFGDSEGNFSVLALKKDPFRFNNFSCDFQMKPVGQFQQGETLVSELFTVFVQLISIHMCFPR